MALHDALNVVHELLACVLAKVSFQAFVAEPFGGYELCHDGQTDRISVRSVNAP